MNSCFRKPVSFFMLVLGVGGAFHLVAQHSTPAPRDSVAAPGGIIRTVAGTDFAFTIPGGLGLNAPLGSAFGMALDSSGNLYIADYNNSVVVKLAPNGVATTVAGNGLAP